MVMSEVSKDSEVARLRSQIATGNVGSSGPVALSLHRDKLRILGGRRASSARTSSTG